MTDGVREMDKYGGNINRHMLFKVVFKMNTQNSLFIKIYIIL